MVNKSYDRQTKQYLEDDFGSGSLNFLYNTFLGRILLKLIFTRRSISKAYGLYMRSRLSKGKINKFIKKYNISLEEYEDVEYKNFNDFFIKQIKKESRPIDNDKNALISVCDGRLKRYKITNDLRLNIKNTVYSLEELVENREVVEKYAGGECLVLRLSLKDYHRYCYIDNGKHEKNIKIKGILHTVQPISQSRYKVYSKNSREWTILNTQNFGDVIQIEVGAILVGKIKNYYENYTFEKGEEKGYFEFGGSTIVLLFKKDIVKIDEDIIENSKEDIETIVKMGEKIGENIC